MSAETLTESELQYIYENMTVAEYLQLDELSKDTLKSYVKKASTSASRAWKKADSEEDKAMSTDGMKYPEKQARHNANANAALKTWRKRDAGLKSVTVRTGKKIETPTY